VHNFKYYISIYPKSWKRECLIPKTNVLTRALICPFLDLYPTYHPTGGVQVLQKAWNLLSDGVRAIFRTAESNLDALSTVDLGPKRSYSVSECALSARLTGPRFAAQVAAVASLVEAPANHCKATTVAKEVMAIMLGNKKGRRSKSSSSRPSPANTPSPFQRAPRRRRPRRQ
jgi:hypothetical protein